MIDVVFPFWPPSVNHAWRRVGDRTVISAAGRDFRREIKKYVLTLRYEQKLPLETLLDDLDVTLVLFPPDRRIRDLDNHFKSTLDAMTHAAIWRDDSLIRRLSDEWGEPTRGGGFRLIVKPFLPRLE